VAKEKIIKIKSPQEAIIEQHLLAVESAQQALVHALNAGRLLIEQKDNLDHGVFVDWVTTSLPFSTRTAQNYMRLARNETELNDSNIDQLTDAYTHLGIKKKTAPAPPPRETHIDEVGSTNEEDPIILQADTIEEAYNEMVHWYWPDLREFLGILDRYYVKLKKQRTHKTPTSLGWAIGQIHDLFEDLSTWNPHSLSADVADNMCPVCGGTTKVEVTSGQTVDCTHCIDGRVGISKENTY
jgi:hypothetical protein